MTATLLCGPGLRTRLEMEREREAGSKAEQAKDTHARAFRFGCHFKPTPNRAPSRQNPHLHPMRLGCELDVQVVMEEMARKHKMNDTHKREARQRFNAFQFCAVWRRWFKSLGFMQFSSWGHDFDLCWTSNKLAGTVSLEPTSRGGNWAACG